MPGDASPRGAGVADVELADTLTRPRASSRPASFVPRMPSQAFAVSRHAKRVRRPTDVFMLVGTLALLLWTALGADQTDTGFQGAVADLITTAPNLLDPIWQVLQDLLVVWILIVLGLALVRRHWGLARDLVVAAVAVVIAAAVAGRLATGEWPDLWEGALRQETPADFPPLVLAMATAVVGVAAPHLTRPYRYAGRWLVLLGALSAAMLGVSDPGGTAGALGARLGRRGGGAPRRRVARWTAVGGNASKPVSSVSAWRPTCSTSGVVRASCGRMLGKPTVANSTSRSTGAMPGTASCSCPCGGSSGIATADRHCRSRACSRSSTRPS